MRSNSLTKAQQLELDELARKCELTPARVVQFARSGETALHKFFTWDDNKAADLFRLEQARCVIRLRVVVIEHKKNDQQFSFNVSKNEGVKTRKYVALSNDKKKDGKTVYHDIKDVMTDNLKRKILLADAISDLLALKKKYIVLSELSQVWEMVDEIAKKEAS